MKKKMLLNLLVETVNKRIPVIAGTGSNNTAAAIEMSKLCRNCWCRWTSCYNSIL